MAAFTNLTEPLIRRAVLHVYNRKRKVQKEGAGEPRLKYKETAADLARDYGVVLTPLLLKSKKVSTLITCQRDQSSNPLCFSFCSLLRCCCCCCRALLCVIIAAAQAELSLEVMSEAWIKEDEGYNSESVRNQIMARFPRAVPAAAGAAGSGARAGQDPTVVTASATFVARQLQLIHGELAGIAGSLRVLADRKITGGRASVVTALGKLLNSSADHDESG